MYLYVHIFCKKEATEYVDKAEAISEENVPRKKVLSLQIKMIKLIESNS